MAFGVNAVGVAIVDDPVGLKHPAFVVDARMAFGRNGVLVLVVDESSAWMIIFGCGLSRDHSSASDRAKAPLAAMPC